jgi:hypothetical protein
MRQARLARILSVLFLMMMQPANQPRSDIAERNELVNAKVDYRIDRWLFVAMDGKGGRSSCTLSIINAFS